MASGGKPEFVKAGYWLASSSSSFPSTNINTDLFTHFFCGFADLNPTTKKVVISSKNQTPISTFSANIKQKAPDAKTLLSIGGESANAKSFALMANQSSGRKAFIESSIALARQYKFDGLDLQWLYPSNPLEMKNLGTLLKEWHDAIVSESQQRSLPQLTLVATVFNSSNIGGSRIYPVDDMQSSLDWINVLAYDFYTPDSSPGVTGPSAAFLNSKTASLSANYGLQQWVQQNYPTDSIVLGLPFFGWAWLLTDSKKHAPFSSAEGPVADISSDGDGRVDYKKITELIDSFSAKKVFDKKDIYNYAYYGTNWISYDDKDAISAKVSEAKKLNLLGYFAWNIENDDEYSSLATEASQKWDE